MTNSLFQAINTVCSKMQAVSDLLWEFPSNTDWYAALPVIGKFPFSIVILLGAGIFLTLRLGFIQIRTFGRGIDAIMGSSQGSVGISPMKSFMLSAAMRIGPGNILGVTGAISAGGPGALLWMWISAFFGMAMSFTESTLAQIFKEREGGEYFGGLPFYGARLFSASAGRLIAVLYVVYALLCLPAQGFNTVAAVGHTAEIIGGLPIAADSKLYWILLIALIAAAGAISFGGIKRVTSVINVLVPLMLSVYIYMVLGLIVTNIEFVPQFFSAVWNGAFKPEAVFGGAFGTALAQGVRRGLMSNEAGQGTITMPSAAASASHPCEQGSIQSVGVFLDTMVICTMSGFVVVMAGAWKGSGGTAWMAMERLPQYLASAARLADAETFGSVLAVLISLSFGLFAFTCLLGFISFSEICARMISMRMAFIAAVRVTCLGVVSFGVLTRIAGIDLGTLWDLSDLANILIAYCNIPLLFVGLKYVRRAAVHYLRNDGTPFTSEVAGIDVPVWDEMRGSRA